MNNFKKTMLVGLTVFTMGAGSFAAHAQQNTPAAAPAGASATAPAAPGATPPPHGGRHGMQGREDRKPMTPEQHAERAAKHAKRLHDKLQITAAQEPAWSAWSSAMQPVRPAGPRPDREEWKSLSTPDRMERQMTMMKDMESRLSTQLAATKTFYAALNPLQRTIFDDNMNAGPRGHGPKHHGRPGPDAMK
jgi:protein CpxP